MLTDLTFHSAYFAGFSIRQWHSHGKTYCFVPDGGFAALFGETKRNYFWISQEPFRFIGIGGGSQVHQSRLEFKMGAPDNVCMEGSKNWQLFGIPTGKYYFLIIFHKENSNYV